MKLFDNSMDHDHLFLEHQLEKMSAEDKKVFSERVLTPIKCLIVVQNESKQKLENKKEQ